MAYFVSGTTGAGRSQVLSLDRWIRQPLGHVETRPQLAQFSPSG